MIIREELIPFGWQFQMKETEDQRVLCDFLIEENCLFWQIRDLEASA